MALDELPNDVQTERLLLSVCLLVDNEISTDEMYSGIDELWEDVKLSDFADDFHAWLFSKIREARQVHPNSLKRQLSFLIARPLKSEARERFHEPNLPYVIARLFLGNDGLSCAGRAKMIKLYVNHLRRIAMYRDHIAQASQELQRAHEQWMEAKRNGADRITIDDKQRADDDSGVHRPRASGNGWQPQKSVQGGGDARKRRDPKLDVRSTNGGDRRLF